MLDESDSSSKMWNNLAFWFTQSPTITIKCIEWHDSKIQLNDIQLHINMTVSVYVEPVIDIPPEDEGTIKITDIFGYHNRPADNISDIYHNNIADENMDEDSKVLEAYYRTFMLYNGYETREDVLRRASDYEKTATVVRQGIRVMYAKINYPVTNPGYFRITFERDITFGMLLYGYTLAYQKMYQQEDIDVGHSTGTISNVIMNRDRSHGRYGIWGHCIEDLVYNGNSIIIINSNNIIAEFRCDS